MTTNQRKVELLKKMLKGLTPKDNFDPDIDGRAYTHCVLGEKHRLEGGDFLVTQLFGPSEAEMCYHGSSAGLTHSRALAMIRQAIKRWSRKGTL